MKNANVTRPQPKPFAEKATYINLLNSFHRSSFFL